MEPLEDFISKFLCRIDDTKVLASIYIFFRPVIIFVVVCLIGKYILTGSIY